MKKLHNSNEILHDALQALRAIENRVNKATEKYAGAQIGKKGKKKYEKILKTSAAQIRILAMMGYSNSIQYRRVRNMLISANLDLDGVPAQEKSTDSDNRKDR